MKPYGRLKFGQQEWLVLTMIIILISASYFTFSADQFLFLNSDVAIHALMTRGFEFYHNLFYWGQNRLGSLLPLIGFFPWKLLGVNPLLSISLAQYGVVALCIMLFHALILRPWLTLLFSIFLLFPSTAYYFILMPGHPYLPHFMLTMAAIFIIQQPKLQSRAVNFAISLTFILLALLSVWVTDMALVTIPLILFWRLLRLFASKERQWNLLIALGVLSILSVPGLWTFGSLLRTYAVDYSGYHSQVAGLDQVINGLKTHANMIFESVYLHELHFWSDAYTVLLTICALMVLIRFITLTHEQRKVIVFSHSGIFILLAIATWGATLFSGWASSSLYPQRYFCFSFMFLVAGLVAFPATSASKVFRTARYLLLVAVALLSAASYKELAADKHRFRVDQEARMRLKAMRSSTIFGDYWYCYTMAAYNADQIIPIPTDGQFFRNGHQLKAALLSDSIFVCSDYETGVFPDTVVQYGNTLIASHEPGFVIGNTTLRRYLVQKDASWVP
ncbi:MAG: hypothetical protein JKX84_02155 [Flavobacteriales bacterium]|nr:hypothetical protein [Flavobacteriales bacterium]